MPESVLRSAERLSPTALQNLRQASTLPQLIDHATRLFHEGSGCAWAIFYLIVSPHEALELACAGKPPARSPEQPWNAAVAPDQALGGGLEASRLLVITQQGKPFALMALGPEPLTLQDDLVLQLLVHATQQGLSHAMLQTRALAADFQEQRANLHRSRAQQYQERLQHVAHDFRNHLVPMLYATEELERCLIAPEALKLVQTLERNLRRADQFSKHSIASLDRTPCVRTDMVSVARAEAEGWLSAFEQRGLGFSFEAPDAPLWVEADPSQLHQILGNLLSNAVKFTPAGGRIRLSLAAHRGLGLLEVKDSGRGIAQSIRHRLFEAPVRGDRTVEGHGLGLANVKAVVKRLGGSISVTSRPGRGSTFQVRLPIRAEALV